MNNASKLTEIDEHLERERKKPKEIEDIPNLREHEQRVKAKIADLREERSARLEIISQNRKELMASQISRIQQTVEKILDEDLNLREKLKLILREHSLTISAILTSAGLISTFVTSLTGGAADGSSTPPKNPNKVEERVKTS